ncbi:serine/threonine-protein kinase VRK1 isoform X2 [Eurytemora carolleeae]|uniref:serine/threonine-protein kinase VRK1 isoform X2 n=1 Tax=Eurytemora carolleeae TaxID=1294199 RepID=UPI000C75692F|nr:serine/threonine-protein kinase VRK1 isoform X2 [Eurytemora carolleeae]|eukprot:XP_023322546.1 serine/threonine-protein kinase VRK1-like isoform X2 [Eurytemora affinis]
MEGHKAAPGCKMAPLVPKGSVLTDMRQKRWLIGKPVGSGAFGAIYLARREGEEEEEYAVKIEPHSNGPLWVEMHAFFRIGLETHRAIWKPRNGKPEGWVGIPNYFGSGSHWVEEEKLRFLVMSRLGSDIQKFFQSGKKPIPLPTALNIGIQIMESLEYVHSKGYAHNDIKAQNVLLAYGQDQNTVYLVDFGLACKYRNSQGFHCSAEPDERKAHEGTLEYTSRDAHTGVHSRRGDLETLGYNLIHWVSGYLPWIHSQEPEFVQSKKIGFMFNVPGFLKKCFKPEAPPKVLEDFMVYVNSLGFIDAPDYSKLRKLFCQAMRREGVEPYAPLVFGNRKVAPREESSDEEEEEDEDQEGTRNTRSQDEDERFAPWSWEQVLSLDPESIIRQASRSSESEERENPEQTAAFEALQEQSLLNPTPEMVRLLEVREELERVRKTLSWKEQLAEYNQRMANTKAKFASMDLTASDVTPAMQQVIDRRAKRLASGICSPITPEPSEDELDELDDLVEVKKALTKGTRRQKQTSAVSPPSGSNTPRTRSGTSTPRAGRGSATPRSRPGSATPTAGSVTPGSRSGTASTVPMECFTRSSRSSRASSPSFSGSVLQLEDSPVRRSEIPRSSARLNTIRNKDDTDSGSGRKTRIKNKDAQFKLPTANTKIACLHCGKLLLEKSMSRHISRFHAEDIETDDIRVKRVIQSPKTPILQMKRFRNNRHLTPQLNQEQEFIPSSKIFSSPEEPQSDPEDETAKVPESSEEKCPMCLMKLPLLMIAQHLSDVHSPARKRTRQVKIISSGVPVHVSSDSPLKIRNMTSPEKSGADVSVMPVPDSVKIRKYLALE